MRLSISRLGKVHLIAALIAGVALSFGLGLATGRSTGQDGDVAQEAATSAQAAGLSPSSWEFLRNFDKPLAQEFDDSTPAVETLTRLHRDLASDYEDKRDLIAERYPDLREPELLITYLALRVAFSMPVLDSGLFLQRQLSPVLLSPRGNCLHHAVRSSIVMDAFGIPSRIAYFSTPPYIMGHAVADVYDPEHRLAAFVDTNKKMVFFLRDVDASFFETVLEEVDKDARAELLDKAIVVELPADVRYFNPSDGHLATWVAGNGPPVVLDEVRERMRNGRVKKTRDAFVEGYERMLTQRTRDGEVWWLRIENLTHFKPIVRGLQSQVPVDNSRIHEIIDNLRIDIAASQQASSN